MPPSALLSPSGRGFVPAPAVPSSITSSATGATASPSAAPQSANGSLIAVAAPRPPASPSACSVADAAPDSHSRHYPLRPALVAASSLLPLVPPPPPLFSTPFPTTSASRRASVSFPQPPRTPPSATMTSSPRAATTQPTGGNSGNSGGGTGGRLRSQSASLLTAFLSPASLSSPSSSSSASSHHHQQQHHHPPAAPPTPPPLVDSHPAAALIDSSPLWSSSSPSLTAPLIRHTNSTLPTFTPPPSLSPATGAAATTTHHALPPQQQQLQRSLGHRKGRYSMPAFNLDDKSTSRDRERFVNQLAPNAASSVMGGAGPANGGRPRPTRRERRRSDDDGQGPPGTSSRHLEAKVVILGMQGVGKTSMVHRYTTGQFSHSLGSTIGASFCIKKLTVDNCKVRLQIWDTAGQERFRGMAPMYYRGANAAIIVYDLTNADSFRDVERWVNELRAMDTDVVIQVVGSKADLVEDRAVDLAEAQRQVRQWTSSNPVSSRDHDPPDRTVGYSSTLQTSSSTSGGGSPGSGSGVSSNVSGAGGGGTGNGSAATMSLGSLGFGARSSSTRKSTELEKRKSRETNEVRDVFDASKWGSIDVTEVSAKDDYGVEDLFLLLTRRLVAKKAEIDEAAWLRSRDSIVLGSDQDEDGRNYSNSWWCCSG